MADANRESPNYVTHRCLLIYIYIYILVSTWLKCWDSEASSQNWGKRLLASSCLSVRPHGTTLLKIDIFSWNLIFEYFTKNLPRKFKFAENWQEYLVVYVKTYVHRYIYENISQFFLEWEMFQARVVEKIRTRILCPVTFFLLQKIVPSMR